MIRIGQFAHFLLIVLVAVSYAILRSALPVDDPDRTLIDAIISVAVAAWGAVVFVEILRGKPSDSLKERALAAYRRLLNRRSTLVAGDLLMTVALAWLLHLLVMYRPVDFYSASDVEVYQNDPGGPEKRIGFLKGTVPTKYRLPLGERWLVFYSTVSQDETIIRRPVYTARLQVGPVWREMKRVEIPEVRVDDKLE